MKINTVLRCKEPEIKSRAYEVSDVITLSDAEFRSVLKESLKDRGLDLYRYKKTIFFGFWISDEIPSASCSWTV